jgi:hypothetical protein
VNRQSHDIGLICQNGHVVNGSMIDFPQFNTKYCEQCGAETISKCPKCSTEIRGSYREGFGSYDRPLYCHNCGQAYPWTESAIAAAKEYADTLEGLSSDEKEIIKKDINELVRDSPKQVVAASRFKKTMQKIGRASADGFRNILVDVLSEAIKKSIWSS